MKKHTRFIAAGLAGAFLALTLASCSMQDPAVVRLRAAQKAYRSALRSQTTANQTLTNALNTLTEDQTALAALKGSQPGLAAAVTQAVQNKTAGEAAYQRSQDATTAAQSALEQLQQEQEAPRKYRNNSLGFFIWNAPDSGSDIDTIKRYFLGQVSGSHEVVPNLNSKTDATSYQNFKASIQWMNKANEMRRRENSTEGTNLSELPVADSIMMISEFHANFSKRQIEHHAYTGLCDFGMGENLAWGERSGPDGPFEAWYTKEKAYYKAHPDGTTHDPVWFSNVGHYLATVSPSYKVIGFAINNDPDCLYGKVYAYGVCSRTLSEKTYTVAQYSARISAYEAYLRSLDTTLHTAQTAVSDARTAEKAAQKELARLDTAITTAEKARDDAAAQAAALEQKLGADQDSVNAAREALTQATETVLTAKQELDAAQKALEEQQASAVKAA